MKILLDEMWGSSPAHDLDHLDIPIAGFENEVEAAYPGVRIVDVQADNFGSYRAAMDRHRNGATLVFEARFGLL